MSDPIERSKAIDVLRNMNAIVSPISDDVLLIDKAEAMTKLMMLPPAKTERKKGKWILKPNIYGVVYCSECDYELHTNSTNFCPNCGTDMRDNKKEDGE